MTLGWLRCGRLFATSYPRRRQGCWRLVAGRWAALSRLLDGGYHSVGVDPEAPDGPDYQRTEFERYEPPQPVDCVVASLSLHHVADLDEVLDRLEALLVPGGALVVVEWAWEQFDEATARWCFARLAPPRPREGAGLAAQAPGAMGGLRPDLGFLPQGLGDRGGLHPGEDIVREPGCALRPPVLCGGAVLLPDLADTSEAEEQSAIDARQIGRVASGTPPGGPNHPAGWAGTRARAMEPPAGRSPASG